MPTKTHFFGQRENSIEQRVANRADVVEAGCWSTALVLFNARFEWHGRAEFVGKTLGVLASGDSVVLAFAAGSHVTR